MIRNSRMQQVRAAADGGFVLAISMHVVLLAVVLGMLVFLAARHGQRLDLTSDDRYTLTQSTESVLERLEDRVLVEAYFSPDDELTSVYRDQRRLLRNVLDEYAARSDGRLQVRYFDPQSDTELRRKAERLGLQPQRIQDVEGTTLANKEIWQGFRFRYGARKQKVVPFLGFTDRTSIYEAIFTPLLKGLTVVERPKIGLIGWPSLPPMSRGYGNSGEPVKYFDRLRENKDLGARYELARVDLAQGQHVPDDIGVLVLLRPKDLTDRQKYVLDQFLMRGGTLVVFADNDDVSIGRSRMFQSRPVKYDAAGSEVDFVEQLDHYGVDTRDAVVADGLSQAEPFRVLVQTAFGQGLQGIPYPYFVQPRSVDWAEAADQLAAVEGAVDEALAARYREEFEPGVAPEVQKVLNVPVLYWPCPVDLVDPLPEGVTGRVLMRTSPRSIVESTPPDLNPIGTGQNMQVAYQKFQGRLQAMFDSEPLQQRGLMVDVAGRFRSYFASRKVPKTPAEEAEEKKREEEAAARDPLEEPVGTDPVADEPADEEIGPQPPEDEAAVEPEPAEQPILEALEGARLVVVGDADFLRDDFISGEYGQVGPYSRLGLLFFESMLDWLAEDRDLLELRNKSFVDRSMQLVDPTELERMEPARREEAVRDRAFLLRTMNIVLPPVLLLLGGLVILLRRQSRKRAFLAEVS